MYRPNRIKREDISPELRDLIDRETAAVEAAREGVDETDNLSNDELRAKMYAEAEAAEADALADIDDGAPLPPHVTASRPNRRRATEADYEAAARSYEAEPPRADEIKSIEFGPGYRRPAADYEAMSHEIGAGEHIAISPVEIGPADSPPT